MIRLTQEEMETTLNITAADRSLVVIYSDDPVMQKKIEAAGARLTKETFDYGHGKYYTLPANQLRIVKPPKPLSDVDRQKRAAQLAKNLESRSASGQKE